MKIDKYYYLYWLPIILLSWTGNVIVISLWSRKWPLFNWFPSYYFMVKFLIIMFVSLQYDDCGKNKMIFDYFKLFSMHTNYFGKLMPFWIKFIFWYIIYFTYIYRLGRYQFTKSQTHFSMEHFSNTQVVNQSPN